LAENNKQSNTPTKDGRDDKLVVSAWIHAKETTLTVMISLVGLKGSPADFDVHFYIYIFIIFLIFLRSFKILYLYHILKLFIKQMSLQTSNKQANRISRRLTVNTDEPFISIRPIIKSKSLNSVILTCLV
jgi:hypothetical protein